MHVVIAGAGRVGSQLATMLAEDGHDVVILDRNADSFRRLGASFNGVTMVGNAFDQDVLRKAGIEHTQVFIAVTDLDNTNIMAGQVARKIFGVPRVIARVYYPDREATYHRLGLEPVCGTTLLAQQIRNRVLGKYFVHHFNLDSEAEVVEISSDESFEGKKVSEIEKPKALRVVAIIHDGEVTIPDEDTVVRKGEALVAVVRAEAKDDIRNALKVVL